MAEPSPISVAWLEDFDRRPADAVGDLLRGIADIAPYERASASDILTTLFGALPEDDPKRKSLDDALSDWIFVRRGDSPETRREYGMSRYVEELTEALTAVYRLRLTGAAHRLRENFASLRGWLASLALGPGQDPALELWRIMALLQPDRRFLRDWYELCQNAGNSLHEPYLNVGQLGLMRLPDEGQITSEAGGRLGRELVAGLFRWAAGLPQGPASRKAFQRRLRALMVLYPRGPNRWRELALPLLASSPAAPFHDWLAGAGLKVGRQGVGARGSFPELPPRSRLEDLLRRVGTEPTSELLPAIRTLVRDYERYAEATGDAQFVVKTATNFSGRLRRKAPREALRLARLAHRWQPSNPYAWTQWASALEALGEAQRAEVVYWEAIRRFPEDEVAPNALANLLAGSGRNQEAEELFRDTIRRFPENEVAPNALAKLLAGSGRNDEAEKLFRETIRRFPDDEVARNALAYLLATTGHDNEAERLFRETMTRFRRDYVAPHALASWLIRWGRVAEAEDLYREIRGQFQESSYTRKLAKEIAQRKEGQQGEVEMPDFLDLGAGLRPAAAAEEDGGASSTPGTKGTDTEEDLGGEEEEKSDSRNTRPSDVHSLAAANTVAEPDDAEYLVEEEEVSEDPLELDPRLFTNAEVSRADLQLRSQDAATPRQEALATVAKIAAADPAHVYPRLVLGLHGSTDRQRLEVEAEAFPHAYPLRFLSAREHREPAEWESLLRDFDEKRPLTLLGRLAAANGNADPQDAQRLVNWAEGSNGSLRGFEAFLAKRLHGWLGEAPRETPPAELLDRLTAHRSEIESLVGAGLRQAADEA